MAIYFKALIIMLFKEHVSNLLHSAEGCLIQTRQLINRDLGNITFKGTFLCFMPHKCSFYPIQLVVTLVVIFTG